MRYDTSADLRRRQAEEDYLNRLHGELPVNPFKRLRVSNHMTIKDLAAQSYTSKTAIIRAEAGTYTNPMPSLVKFWVERSKVPTSELTITEDYEDFQYAVRKRNMHYFGVLRYNINLTLHPLRQIRTNKISHVDGQRLPVGPNEVSKALCLPQDTLHHFEKKFRSQQTVPKQLLSVLLLIGYDRSTVMGFNSDYCDWRNRMISESNASVSEKIA